MSPRSELTFDSLVSQVSAATKTRSPLGRLRTGFVLGGLFVLCTGGLFADRAAANGESIFLACPCVVEGDGTTLRLTAGIRSFKSKDSAALYFGVSTVYERGNPDYEVARVEVADTVEAGTTLESSSYEVAFEIEYWRGSEAEIELVLYEGAGFQAHRHDRVRMDARVELNSPFQVNELDFLEDTDGDGVGDINERLEGTDPTDASSVPGDSTIDVLALYSQEVSDLYGGDPTTRIQHTFTLANQIVANSNV